MTCEKHEDVKETLKKHEERLDKCEQDIGDLQISDGAKETSIENLVKSVDSLASWVKIFIIAAFGTLFTITCASISFIVWYIQKG